MNQAAVQTHIKVKTDLFCDGIKIFSKDSILRIVAINKSGCAAVDDISREIFIIRPGNYEIVETVH